VILGGRGGAPRFSTSLAYRLRLLETHCISGELKCVLRSCRCYYCSLGVSLRTLALLLPEWKLKTTPRVETYRLAKAKVPISSAGRTSWVIASKPKLRLKPTVRRAYRLSLTLVRSLVPRELQ
jgi:hypothetical protein